MFGGNYVESFWDGLSDINDDGIAEDFGIESAHIGHFDVNGDGYPDRVKPESGKLVVQLWDPGQSAFVTNAGSTISIQWSVDVLEIWDLDGDGRLEVLSTGSDDAIHCHELGPETWSLYSSLPPRISTAYTTWQWDNYEPNEGADTNGDGLPDQVVRLPSALTAVGQFHSLISTATDQDYYMVNPGPDGTVCLRSPKARNYGIRVYAMNDLWNNTTKAASPDGEPDGLIWEDDSAAQQKCFTATAVSPHRFDEFRYIIGIRSVDGSHSIHWPYYIHTPR